MEVLNNAAEKIKAFNSNPKDRPRESYHCVLRARAGKKSVVDEDGSVSGEYLRMIDWALRSYFMMNRRNRMGSEEEFVNKLMQKLSRNETKKILARLRDVTILSTNLEDYGSDAEELYECLSNCENGLSADGTYFCVGATKVMHCLFPELFVMLDRNVGKTALKQSSGQYNNFASYWKIMRKCKGELVEWQELYGSTKSLLKLDLEPTTLTRIFDKCATIAVV